MCESILLSEFLLIYLIEWVGLSEINQLDELMECLE